MHRLEPLILLAIGLALLGGAALAAPPAGRVSGTVRLDGPRPPARPAAAASVDPAVCGPSVADESLVVASDGGVRDAVVVLRGVEGGAPGSAGEALVDNAHCRFAPHVQVIERGQTVRVRNDDPVLHNAHPVLVASPEVSIANLALGVQGQTMDLTPRLAARVPPAPEALVRLGCDVHPWMRGWLVIVDHRYHAVTGADGRFTLAGVPPGRYTLAIWHETLGRAERAVGVEADTVVTVDVALAPPP